MGRGPEVKVLLSDSRRKNPLLRVTADTPCRLLKIARSEVLSRSRRLSLEGNQYLLEDLGLERVRLREENARADSRGAWNPS